MGEADPMALAVSQTIRRIDVLDEHKLPERVLALERAFFGYFDNEHNCYVPGLLQTSADVAKNVRTIREWGMRAFWLAFTFVVLGLAHEYNLWDAIIRAVAR